MTRRIEQVNELLRKELASFIRRSVEFPLGVLVTVTRVETSDDLERAHVFVSVLPFPKHEEVMRILMRQRSFLQGLLNRTIVMRRVPALHFILDAIEEKASEVESILDMIKANE